MGDTYTETTTTSWMSRLGDSFKGVLVGIVLFIAGFPVLFWNEGRSVKRINSLKQGADEVQTVASDRISAEMDGKLIHTTGHTAVSGSLSDEKFGVTAEKALRLNRRVEMYQWRESIRKHTEKKMGGKTETTTTYDYDKGWSSSYSDSTQFKYPAGHENPPLTETEKEWMAKDVSLGLIKLTPNQIATAGRDQPVQFDANSPLPQGLEANYVRTQNGFYRVYALEPAKPASAKATPSLAAAVSAATNQNVAANAAAPAATGVPATPQIGDLRITFTYRPETDLSLVGQQQSGSIVPYTTKNGGTIMLQSDGIKAAGEMFQSAQDANKMMTWLLRLAGFLLMFFGLKMFFGPLSTLTDVVPFIGKIVSVGFGIVSFLIAMICSLFTIGIAWIFYRPLIGIPFIVVAVALTWMLRKRVNAAKSQTAVTAPAA